MGTNLCYRVPQGIKIVEPVPSCRWQRFAAFSVEPGLHEYGDPLDRSPSLWDDARVVVPAVRHAQPFLEFNFATGSAELFSHPDRIVAQDFIAADLDEQRRKSRCVPVKRRRIRMPRIGSREIALRVCR